MNKITPAEIAKLRQATGAGMMSAKSALEEADGNFDRAIEILRRRGEASAAKRAQRATEAGLVEAYVHNGKIGVLVELNCETDFVARTDDFKNLAHNLAMQVAASAPQYVAPTDVPADVVAKERQLYADEAKQSGKPDNVLEQIVAGKLDKFYAEVCLLQQPFLKDPDTTVEQQIKSAIAKLGENITVRRFVRFELGE